MKKIEDMTIPELIHAWDSETDLGILSDLSRALDLKCEEAGIKLWPDDVLSFSKFGDKTDNFVCVRAPASDLHLLIGYLLGK